jgi:hypothetical protein
MSDPFAPVSAGDGLQIPAAGWNAAMEAARRFTRERLGVDEGRPLTSTFAPANVVLVRGPFSLNEVCPAFTALVLAAPLQDVTTVPHDFQARPAFGSALTSRYPNDGCGRVCVTIEPIVGQSLGRAVVAGVAVARVYVNDATHEYAAIDSRGTGTFESARNGYPILYQPGATGYQWCVVLLGARERPTWQSNLGRVDASPPQTDLTANAGWTLIPKTLTTVTAGGRALIRAGVWGRATASFSLHQGGACKVEAQLWTIDPVTCAQLAPASGVVVPCQAGGSYTRYTDSGGDTLDLQLGGGTDQGGETVAVSGGAGRLAWFARLVTSGTGTFSGYITGWPGQYGWVSNVGGGPVNVYGSTYVTWIDWPLCSAPASSEACGSGSGSVSGSGSGSGSSGGGGDCCDAELAAHPDLDVDEPALPGTPFTATYNSGSGRWEFALGGAPTGEIWCEGGVWKYRFPVDTGTTISAWAQGCDPFFALFQPGLDTVTVTQKP